MTRINFSQLTLLLVFSLLVACTSSDSEPTPATDDDLEKETNTEASTDYVFDSAITSIALNGTAIGVTGSGVTVAGSSATITTGGTYSVSGSLSNGQLIVAAKTSDIVKIILNNASIVNASNAPLYAKSADKVVIYLTPDTQNALTDGTLNELDGSLYSIPKLSLFGSGSLTVTGMAKGGIISEGGLIIKEGTYTVRSAESSLRSDMNLVIDGGNFTLDAGNDGIHGEESLTFNGGTVNIIQSEEGIESKVITINDGTHIQIASTDDGLNASSGDELSENYFYMNGGYVYINSTGDGVDANGYIEMTGGVIIVDGPTQTNNAAIDYDRTFTISGGVVLAVGSSRMAQAPSQTSTQNSLKITFTTTKSASQLVHLQNSDGTAIATFRPAKSYQSFVLSTSSLTTGNTYALYLGGSATGTLTNGLYENETYSGGILNSTITISNTVTNSTSN